MKNCRFGLSLALGFFLIVIGISGCSDPNKDFYGRWSGQDNLGVIYDYEITKDYIAEYVDGVVVSKMKYKNEKLGVKDTLQISDEELKKGIPELETSEFNSSIVFSLSDDKESIDLFIALDGVAGTGKLFKNSTAEETNSSISERVVETNSIESSMPSYETTDDQSNTEVGIGEKIDTFIATYTSIPSDWTMEKEHGGITIRSMNYTATNDAEASSILSNLQGISNSVKTLVGSEVPLRLLEQDNHDYSVIFVNGEVTSSNDVYGKVIGE